MTKIVIFGAGIGGSEAYKKFSINAKVIVFSDNDKGKQGGVLCNLPIVAPEELVSLDFDYVVIVSNSREDIKHQLDTLGVPDEKIVQDNDRLLDALAATTSEALKSDVFYAYNTACAYVYQLGVLDCSIDGRRILEVGPGKNIGSAFYYEALGARITVADRFLAEWDPYYHPQFYEALYIHFRNEGLYSAALEEVIEQGGYGDGSMGSVTMVPSSLEELVGNEQFDACISNAVFEHLYDHKQALASLYRLTIPDGVGVHQVDYRFHRNFDRPLDHLLLSRNEFFEVFERSRGGCGMQLRPLEFEEIIKGSGFEIADKLINMKAEEEYLNEIVSQLSRAGDSPYHGWTHDELRGISAMYWLRRSDA